MGPELASKQLPYWLRQLAGASTFLDLQTDRPRPSEPANRGGRAVLTLPGSLADDLRGLGRRDGATLFMTLLAAFQALLLRRTGQEDFLVGSPVAGRTRQETERLIGCFVNTLVLCARPSENMRFRELLRQVRQTSLEAYEHQDLPFARLVEELRPGRDPGRVPLIQVTFQLRNYPQEAVPDGPLRFEPVAVDAGVVQFDLDLMIAESPAGLDCQLTYDADLFDAATAERMLGNYRTLLEGIAADPERPIGELPLLTDAERRWLRAWNDTHVEFPEEHLLHRLVEVQVRRTPDAPAVVCEGRSLSYRELDRRASLLARRLHALGVGPDATVGVCMERSCELVVALLGVLKAGGAYLPLDPDYPADRLALMLHDAAPSAVVAQRRLGGRLPPWPGRLLWLDADGDADSDVPDMGDLALRPDHLAYVIYTSGSTGTPKGVMNTHRGVCNHCLWMQRQYRLTPQDAMLQKTPFSFDMSVSEFFWPLLAGARVVLARPGGHRDPASLAALIGEERVTVCHFVPSMLRPLLREPGLEQSCASLRDVFCGGEALPYELQEEFFAALPCRLHNLYGPTEAAVEMTYWECRRGDPRQVVPIGRPMANTQMHVLDGGLQPLPVGTPGELYIGGVQLARGYLNRPELTADRFIQAPGLGRLYRTGDRGRWLDDGSLEYLGRLDDQVKLHGIRIELGEVEAPLTAHPRVRQAVVLLREDRPGDRRLTAYVVPRDGDRPTAADLRSAPRTRLPAPLVPSAFVFLDRLPLTPNGKVDRKALPAPGPDRPELGPAYAPPRTPGEEALAGIWAPCWGWTGSAFTTTSSSWAGTRCWRCKSSRACQVFAVKLHVRSLFEAPTVAGLAQRVAAAGWTGRDLPTPPLRPNTRPAQLPSWRSAMVISPPNPLPPNTRPAKLPLSFAQERLWFLDQLGPGRAIYNEPLTLQVRGPLDVAALERSLQEVLRRHEVLRTTFRATAGLPEQVVAQETESRLSVTDLRQLPEQEREAAARRLAVQDARAPFDLSRDLMMRARLLRLGDEDHWLSLTLHHIAVDGWSLEVLRRELTVLYTAFAAGGPSPLAALPLQYADFAVWQRQWLPGEAFERQLRYWKRQLAGAPPTLDLATDRPRPALRTFRGARQTLPLGRALSQALRELSGREGATPFMTLLAAFQILLSRYSGQEDVVVGAPIAGRTHRELEGLIGFFVNMLVLRTDLSGDPTFRALLGRVREAALEGYAHQDLPFEKLVAELQPERTLQHSPLVQVLFVLQYAPRSPLEFGQATVSQAAVDSGTAKFDLTLSIREEADGWQAELEYSTDLFDAATAERMLGNYRTLLEGIAADPSRRLSELPLLADEERRQVLIGWNATQTDYPREQCIHELFEAQVERTPDAVAVVCAGPSG